MTSRPAVYTPRRRGAQDAGREVKPLIEFDFGLGESVELLRHTVRDFARELIVPRAREIDGSNAFPRDLWPELGSLGLLGITVETEFGGSGLGYLEHVIAMEEISRASGSVGLSFAAHSHLCVDQIRRWGTPEQKRRYLPKLLTGHHVGALAMNEPDTGADVSGMRLEAELRGNFYVLNGRKSWITNGPEADVLVVYGKATTDVGTPGLTAFLVERSLGFRTTRKLDKLGMRGSDISELVFDDCRIPIDNMLHEPGRGFDVLNSGLDFEHVVLAGGPLGLMHACLDVALPFVREKKAPGKSMAASELIQARIADLYTALNASRAYVYSVAQACDRQRAARSDAAGALLYASERATECALKTIQTLGGIGYLNEYSAGRLLRDAKLYELGVGTNESRRLSIGQELLGG
jgi:isovaleryl-CoA dehydrogenase